MVHPTQVGTNLQGPQQGMPPQGMPPQINPQMLQMQMQQQMMQNPAIMEQMQRMQMNGFTQQQKQNLPIGMTHGQPQMGQINPAMMQQQQGPDMMDEAHTKAFEEFGANRKEVSLKTLTKKQREKIMKSATKCKDIAKQYFETHIQSAIKDRNALYYADADYYAKKFPRLSKKSKWVSKDVQTSIEWMMPSFMEAFCGSENPVSIHGVDVQDDLIAKKVEGILKIQLDKQNNAFSVLEPCIREALKTNFGIVKLWWNYETIKYEEEVLLSENMMDQIMQLAMEEQQGMIEMKKIERVKEAPDLIHFKFDRIKVKKNQPVIEYLPPAELLFTPDARTLEECKFVAHRKIVKGDYLKRKEKDGIYQDVDKALEKVGNTNPNELEYNNDDYVRRMRTELTDGDDATKNVELIEAYMDCDYNDDGIAEKLIVHMVDDVPIRISLNEYGFKPFFVCYAKKDPNKVFSNESYADLIKEQQDLKTALVKQIIINVAQTNAAQRVIDMSRIDMDAFLAGDEVVGADIPDGGSIGNYVFSIETPPISNMTMDLVNYAQNEVESLTGSTRYNQGLDSNSLNRTATGITSIMGASEKKIKMIARSMAETFYVPMIKAMIKLDQKFMKDDEIFRINNESFSIRREDLDVDFDLTINVGSGAGTKEARIQYLMLMIQQLLTPLVQVGIADENTIFNVAKNLLEEMGLRGTAGTLLDPQDPEVIQKKEMAKQQQAQQAQAAANMQMQLKERDQKIEMVKAVLPRMSIRFSDMPLEAKDKVMEILGLGTHMGMYLEGELNAQNQAQQPEGEQRQGGPPPNPSGEGGGGPQGGAGQGLLQ